MKSNHERYDFGKGERGKFFRPNADLRLPIHLNADVEACPTERATEKSLPPGKIIEPIK